MENASKALLIAAGVLVVILIIAVSMRVFNSTNGITDDAYEVGESIETETLDASKGAISALKDIYSKNLINIPDKRIEVKNGSTYSIYKTNFYPEKGKEYILQFDYNVIENLTNKEVQCGIGLKRDDNSNDYGSDRIINDHIPYQNGYSKRKSRNC